MNPTRQRIPVSIVSLAVLSLASFLLSPATGAEPGNDRPPNFVVILVDDLGWNDIGCYGSKFYETPNLDAFAKTATRFTNAYAAGSVCSPTRAALMTGLYPARVNITDWIAGRGDRNQKLQTPGIALQLPLEQVTLAERLKSKNYRTCFAGKWHLGSEGFYPDQQGFDENHGGHSKGSPPGGYYAPYKNAVLKNGPDGEYLPDRLTNESIRFIEKNREHPFLLYLSFYTVHTPIQPCKRHLKKFEDKKAKLKELEDDRAFIAEHGGWSKQRQDNARYASMIHAMDENVGRLLKTLEKLKLDENTVVIFTSDNGGLCTLPRKSAPTALLPLRAGKGWLYEGGIRVPLLVRAPGVSKPGSVSDQPAISMDVFQTVMDFAGLAKKDEASKGSDGISLRTSMENPESISERSLFWHYPHYHGSAWKPGAAVRTGPWKLVQFYESNTIELYNLDKDIGESKNLAERMPDRRDKMLKQLQDWQKQVGAKLPRERK